MPFTFEAYLDPNGVNMALTNITSVDLSWGRQNVQDNYQGVAFRFNGFNPSGWSQRPAIGDFVKFRPVSTSASWFIGKVSNFTVRYGLKTSMDTWEMTLDGPLLSMQRIFGTLTTTADASTSSMVSSIASIVSAASGPTDPILNGSGSTTYGSTTSAQTISDNVSNMAQLFLRTEGGSVRESNLFNMAYAVTLEGRNYRDAGFLCTYSDAGTVGTIRYKDIVFRSSNENYANKVVVSATGYADQSFGTGTYSTQFSTINASTTQAADLAGYYYTELNLSTNVPFSITSDSTVSNGLNFGYYWPSSSGNPLQIVFRGNTYSCIAIGGDLTMDIDQWRGTLYLVSSLSQAWLVLDSSTLGLLDTNKLGF